jgi:GT2 family glycosyltransferase
VGGRILARPTAGLIEKFGEVVHNHDQAIHGWPPYLITMNLAVPLAVLRKHGGFDERWLRSQDSEMSFRLASAGYRFAYSADAIVYHRNRSTLPELWREGYLHGRWGASLFRQYAYLAASEPEARPTIPVRLDWKNRALARYFKLAKRVGWVIGKHFPPPSLRLPSPLKCEQGASDQADQSPGAPPASIVMPLLSQVDEWLEKAVVSALLQSVRCEVIVVTSPRTPASNREILARLSNQFPQLRVLEREPHMRFAAAWNMGVRAARASRVGILLTDDWLASRAVETCLQHDADIVSTNRTFYHADGIRVMREVRAWACQEDYERLKTNAERATLLGHFFVFRKEPLLASGGVDETIGDSPGVDDFDLIWCLLDRGATVAVVEEELYNYRDHDGVRLTTRTREEMFVTFNRILDKHGVFGAERKEMLDAHSEWFGKSIWSVYQERMGFSLPAPLRPFQTLYRKMISPKTRFALHGRIVEPLVRALRK